MAPLVGVTPDLRTILASHVPFQFVDGRHLGTPDYVQRHRLMRVAAKAFDFEIEIARVERVTQCWRGLGRSLKAELRWFQALQASRSACLRASAARAAVARIDAP